jgi:hypothetical protein
VLIRFGDTPVRLLGVLVSVASLLLAWGILIWQWVREQRLT